MWEMILAGRFMMIPIGIASLVGLTVIIERIIVLRQRQVIVPEIAGAVETLSASQDLSVAYAICERKPGPFANVIKAGTASLATEPIRARARAALVRTLGAVFESSLIRGPTAAGSVGPTAASAQTALDRNRASELPVSFSRYGAAA